MPDYKKAKFNKKSSNKYFKRTEQIVMKNKDTEKAPSSTAQFTKQLKIVFGGKNFKKRRNVVLGVIILALVVSIVVSSLLLPTGLFDTLKTGFSLISFKNSLPISLKGNELIATADKNGYFYTLTDTYISAFSDSGKELFTNPHGFSLPVLCESETRCLLYDQNGNGIQIYRSGGQMFSLQNSHQIYAADISRCGYFAVAGKSDSFTSKVAVYDNDGKVIFEWFCAEDIINAVALSPNGKNLAVNTVGTMQGKFVSNVYIFKFDSAEPIFSKRYDGNLVYAINSVRRGDFTVIGENFADIISWKKHTVSEYDASINISEIKSSDKLLALRTSIGANDTESNFIIFNKKNTQVADIQFKSKVTDYAVLGKNILVLSNNEVVLIDYQGNIIKSGNSSFGAKEVIPISKNKCLVTTDNSVELVLLN